MIVGSAGIVLIICMLILLCAASLSTDGAFLGWAAVCMAVFALLLWISVVWIIKPYRRMEQSTRLFLEGYTTNNLSGIDETYLMPSSRFMEERLQRMLDSSELLKLNKRQAQYLAIQNQINPHFLYNTLESIGNTFYPVKTQPPSALRLYLLQRKAGKRVEQSERRRQPYQHYPDRKQSGKGSDCGG